MLYPHLFCAVEWRNVVSPLPSGDAKHPRGGAGFRSSGPVLDVRRTTQQRHRSSPWSRGSASPNDDGENSTRGRLRHASRHVQRLGRMPDDSRPDGIRPFLNDYGFAPCCCRRWPPFASVAAVRCLLYLGRHRFSGDAVCSGRYALTCPSRNPKTAMSSCRAATRLSRWAR